MEQASPGKKERSAGGKNLSPALLFNHKIAQKTGLDDSIRFPDQTQDLEKILSDPGAGSPERLAVIGMVSDDRVSSMRPIRGVMEFIPVDRLSHPSQGNAENPLDLLLGQLESVGPRDHTYNRCDPKMGDGDNIIHST
jgi:hypothetical protein